jgi:hypothetical protein
MTRFLPYHFQEQYGDELVFIDVLGRERLIPFRIMNVALPSMQKPLFFSVPDIF